MRPKSRLLALTAVAFIATALADSPPADLPQRHELERTDLSGAPGMEVITSVTELHKGETLPRHSHHGIESGYVLQGTMVQLPGEAPRMMPSGASILNLRDVPHAGFTVVGEVPLKLLSVHIVDKGRPLYEWTH